MPFIEKIVQRVEKGLNSIESDIPSDFSEAGYLALNPDVAAAGMSAKKHYIRYGRDEGRAYKLKDYDCIGNQTPDPQKMTLLLVSHEASRTGAPIVCLKLAEQLKEKYNIITLILGDGALSGDFFALSCTTYITTQNHPFICYRTVQEILHTHKIDCAIVNSVVSIYALEELHRNRIPTISLVHEFTTYINPRSFMEVIVRSSSELVFSAATTLKDAKAHIDKWQPNERTHVIPQGRCVLQGNTEERKVDETFRPSGWPIDTKVIMGAGSFNFRKGVEFFIQCSAYILRESANKNIRFIWFGSGYDPDKDFEFSVYFKEQIVRSGLQSHLEIAGNIGSLEYAYKKADAFLLTSRLDPLPNVGLDAVSVGLPIFCFEGASGIADILEEYPIGKDLVSPYADSYDMAQKVGKLLGDPQLYNSIASELRNIGRTLFSMDRYVSSLEALISEAITTNRRDVKLAENISKRRLIDLDFWNSYGNIRDLEPRATVESAAWDYVREIRAGINRRRPMRDFDIFEFSREKGLSIEDALNLYSDGTMNRAMLTGGQNS